MTKRRVWKPCYVCEKTPKLLIKSPKLRKQGDMMITGTVELFDLCLACFIKQVDGLSLSKEYVE